MGLNARNILETKCWHRKLSRTYATKYSSKANIINAGFEEFNPLKNLIYI